MAEPLLGQIAACERSAALAEPAPGAQPLLVLPSGRACTLRSRAELQLPACNPGCQRQLALLAVTWHGGEQGGDEARRELRDVLPTPPVF